MAQRGNYRRTEHKTSFNSKDPLKVLLRPIGTDPQPGSNRPQAVRSYNNNNMGINALKMAHSRVFNIIFHKDSNSCFYLYLDLMVYLVSNCRKT